MSKIKFKRTVLRAATILQEQGYQPSERHPAPDIVQFYKELTPGVRCEIEFDLKSHFIRPKRNFSVNMLRSRLPSFPPDESRYAWLNLTLENFMWFAYKIEAPLGGWEFEDETGLHAQKAV